MKEYKIKNIDDILQIPEDRLDMFWPDLKDYIEHLRKYKKLFSEIEMPPPDSHMTWADDGKIGFLGTRIHIKEVKES